MQYVHYPVMHREVLEYLVPERPDSLMVDCTLGEGGHSNLFLAQYSNLRVIGLDRDCEIQKKAINRLSSYGSRFTALNTWYDDFWNSYHGEKADLVLFDLGISVFHYEESGRGFSFRKDERLDMRLDVSGSISAEDIVNTYPEQELADLIYKYGEERYSRRIASSIVKERKECRITGSQQLAEIIWNAVPYEYRRCRIHPATKTFQALRIEVNGELGRIETALSGAVSNLADGGRIAVITFHSLEDRIVKWFFRNNSDSLEILTKKPVVPSEEECETNSPSRSAKLRVVERKSEEERKSYYEERKHNRI